MAQIEDEILDAFFQEVESSEKVNGATAAALKKLFAEDKIPRTAELVAAFSALPEDGLS